MDRCPLCACQPVVQFLLLERFKFRFELILHISLERQGPSRFVAHATHTSSIWLPMPTGLDIASDISFVRSICSRIESIV